MIDGQRHLGGDDGGHVQPHGAHRARRDAVVEHQQAEEAVALVERQRREGPAGQGGAPLGGGGEVAGDVGDHDGLAVAARAGEGRHVVQPAQPQRLERAPQVSGGQPGGVHRHQRYQGVVSPEEDGAPIGPAHGGRLPGQGAHGRAQALGLGDDGGHPQEPGDRRATTRRSRPHAHRHRNVPNVRRSALPRMRQMFTTQGAP